MATSTSSSTIFSNISSPKSENPSQTFVWDKKYVIENLPPYIYESNEPPSSFAHCEAKISSIELTIIDIDIQIDIKQAEMNLGSGKYSNNWDFEKWRVSALRAKQNQYYLLNAYKYWLKLNDPSLDNSGSRFNKLLKLLIDEPGDFVQQAQELLDCH